LTSYTVSVRLRCTSPNFRLSIRDHGGENAGWMALDDDAQTLDWIKMVAAV